AWRRSFSTRSRRWDYTGSRRTSSPAISHRSRSCEGWASARKAIPSATSRSVVNGRTTSAGPSWPRIGETRAAEVDMNAVARQIVEEARRRHYPWAGNFQEYGVRNDREAKPGSIRYVIPMPARPGHTLSVLQRGYTLEVSYDDG